MCSARKRSPQIAVPFYFAPALPDFVPWANAPFSRVDTLGGNAVRAGENKHFRQFWLKAEMPTALHKQRRNTL